MPPTLTYPGVYIAEAPSSVHTITGVATSIGAFFGQAAMGPLNTPIECLSPSDYTRTFGGPVAGANLAQSVQQFFANGGSDCFVVRLADGAQPAQVILNNINGGGVLQLSAASAGLWGAGLSAYVDYNTPNPDSTFNLTVENVVSGVVAATESFANLSLDPSSATFAPTFVTQSSQLITAAAGAVTATGIAAGYSEGRALIVTAVGGWQAALAGTWPTVGDQGSFQISVDGGSWTQINLSKAALLALSGTDADTFSYVQTAINNALGLASGTSVTVGNPADLEADTDFLRITSSGTLKSSVQVKPATSSDIAQALMLGVNQGGIEVARYSDLRPIPNGICFAPKPAPNLNGEIVSAMDELALAHVNDVTGVTLNGTAITFAWPAGNPQFNVGASATDKDGVRENLQFMADTINSKFPGYSATVNGYRLFIENLSPPSANWTDTFTVKGDAASNNFSTGFISNVQGYPFGQSGGATYWTAVVPPPSDGNPPTLADYLGNQLLRQGFYSLDSVDLFNLMVLPGDGINGETEWQAIRSAAAVYCQTRRAFLLLDAPVTWTQNNLLTAKVSDMQNFRQGIGDPDINVAVFYPRVQINDQGTLRYMGPSGMIAGICAATDAANGVWTAPAGTNAALTGVTGLEVVLTDLQNGILNPQAINCIRRMPAGYLVWGTRTVAGFTNSGTQWTYIPVRRMALFLEESLYQGTQWAVFQPNAEPLWAQIRMNLSAFMMSLFTQGAFAGTTPSTAFFVKCDSETTTPTDIDNGIVNIVVGFAPLEPAEFVVITIQQISGS
jgi:phage tail sheath protein FI